MSKKRKEQKPHDPAYMLKQSQVKSHIDMMLKSDPTVQKAIQEEVRRAGLAEAQRQAEDIDAILLMGLHLTYGLGRKRLMRFVKTLADLRKYYGEVYEDCDIDAIKLDLKRYVRIDVAEFEREVEVYATQESAN